MPLETFVPAVRITSAFKRYTKTAVVLNGLNMTVKRGTIYGLLGPSGCGKTTLLGCIVGMARLDSGDIELAYTERKQLGYMPQEVSLSSEFTIHEAFIFYGTIFGLTRPQIEKRMSELCDLLELPSLDRRIKNCSGGQQRRISMGVTLFHDPELLILDEPTVGVDPLLSHKIWEFFIEIVAKRGKTIIITTHYIEEAKNAHMIGLMRGGVLLAENSPRKLMARDNTDSLEEAFLNLSVRQSQLEKQLGEQDKTIYPDGPPPNKTMQRNQLFVATRFKAQFNKMSRTSLRNLYITLFVILLPPVNISLMNLTFHTPKVEYPIGVLNEEGFSCDGSQSDYIPPRDCLPATPFSCIFVALLKETTEVVEFDTLQDGLKAVKTLRTNALLNFRVNFSDFIMERLEDGGESSDEAADLGNIIVYNGDNDHMVRVSLTMTLITKMQDLLREVCRFCNFPEKLGTYPVEIVQGYYGEFFDYVGQAMPGYLTAFLFYANFMFMSANLVSERNSGCFERDRISGLTMLETIAAQICVQHFIMVLQDISAIFILYAVFGNTINGSLFLVICTLYLCQLLGIFYGILVAIIVKQDTLVSYCGIGTVLSITLLNGCLWATEGMHWLLKPTGIIMKGALGADAYTNITLRGWGFFHWGVGDRLFYLVAECGSMALLSYALINLKIITF